MSRKRTESVSRKRAAAGTIIAAACLFLGALPLSSMAAAERPLIVDAARFPGLGAVRAAQGGGNGDYHSYAELETDLFALERKYPLIAKVFDIGDSLEKRQIYALKISDNVSFEEEEARSFSSAAITPGNGSPSRSPSSWANTSSRTTPPTRTSSAWSTRARSGSSPWSTPTAWNTRSTSTATGGRTAATWARDTSAWI